MTRPAHLAALALALALAACGGKKPASRAATSPPQAAPAAPAAPAATEAPRAEWSYSAIGKRDPFRSPVSEAGPAQATVTRCSSPLGRFELDQLKLVAVVTGLDDPVAMVEAPNGTGYHLRRGACIGRNGGVISTVRTGEVVVSEPVVRSDGKREHIQVILRLPREAALNLEE
jgi:type IV pilus assembly protein PilP